MSKRGLLLVVSGPSGAGKGTVVKKLREMIPSLGFSVSATTRAPREGEEDGKDYYFVTREKFLQMVSDGEMLEYNEYCGNLYGTPKKEADKASENGIDLILEIESNGAFNVKRLMPDTVLVMIMPESIGQLEDRLRTRDSESEEVIAERLSTAAHEVMLSDKYDYVLVNETGMIDECAGKLCAILCAEHHKSGRMNDEIKNFLHTDEETEK